MGKRKVKVNQLESDTNFFNSKHKTNLFVVSFFTMIYIFLSFHLFPFSNSQQMKIDKASYYIAAEFQLPSEL